MKIVTATTLLAALFLCPGSSSRAADGKPKPPCCFTNPRYAGVCGVQPTGDETCRSILAYLNMPDSGGKVYCEATTIRGGWARVACATRPSGLAR
jgi:hypothetical protein